MSLTEQYGTSKGKETDGVWAELGVNEDGSIPRMKLSRMSRSNKKYMKMLDKVTKPHRRAIELEIMPEEQAHNLSMGVFVNTILLGWENIPLSDVTGVPKDKGYVEFSKDNALALFDRLPDLYEDLQERAKKASLFRDEAIEAEAGN